MSDKLKVFISTVSAQFKDCRDALASDLRAIGCEVKVQEDFQQGADTLIGQIEAYVELCDRVIALVGDAYGCEAAKAAVPDTDPPRSYTQWEYYFALGEQLNGTQAEQKERYVYFASQDFLDQHRVDESAQFAEYQSSFGQMLKDSGKHWAEFSSLDQLCRLVLKDGWKMNERPSLVCNLPYDSLGHLFKGREGFIENLHEHLQQSQRQAAALVSKQAIHGLGGIGKTRLAVEYAWRFKAEYCALLFIGTDSEEALHRNLAALCQPSLLNLPEHDATEEDKRVAAVLRWFSEHSGWLLILDNVDTTDAASAVEKLFNQLQQGHVLVTSRLSDWSGDVDTLELDVLDETDAVAFILERTQQRRRLQETDTSDALALAKELGGLALALEQASAFIVLNRLAIAEYLQRWREREAKVREWHDERLMHYPLSVAVTWDASVNQLDAAALGLLQILCWFAAEPIPRELLRVSSAEQLLVDRLSLLDTNSAETAKPDLEDALAMLVGYSLVKWEDNNSTFSLHRLVADMACSRIAQNQRSTWLTAALAWVNDYLPSDPPPQDVRSWPFWVPLRGHLTELIKNAVAENINEPTTRLAIGLGSLLFTQGQWKEAEPLMQLSLTINENSFGAEHPKVVTDLNNLALLLKATNRLEEAEQLMHRALTIVEVSFGVEHPNVARVLNNLASLLQDTNRPEEAEPMMRRALTLNETSFGAKHPSVAVDLNNLALLLKATNRLEEAEPLMRRALTIDKTSFGPEHPNVARDLNNLAQLLKATNRLDEAEPLMRRALTIDKTSFGPEHPNVARDLNNLAQLLQDTNRLEEAEPMMRGALTIDETSFGPEHPNVARDLNNLALLLQDTNRLEEAEPMMRRVLTIDETSFGPEHPNVANGLNSLARLLQDTNRLEEAEPLIRRALTIDEISLGVEHPNVAIDLNNLALLLQATNRQEKAEPLMRRCLEIIFKFTEATGFDHPNLQAAIENYTLLLQQIGKTETKASQHIMALAKSYGIDLGPVD